MKCIINADDFGIDLDRDFGIFFCAIFKLISSTSVIITNKLSFIQKLMIKIMKKRISIGIHLNLTDNPLIICKMEDLCKKNYKMKPKHIFWTNCLKGEINMKLIKKEIEQQILKFNNEFGFYPEHIDCHNHCNIFNRQIHLQCQFWAKKFNINLRIPYENYEVSELIEIFNDDLSIDLKKYPKDINYVLNNLDFYYKYDMVLYNYLCNKNCCNFGDIKFLGSVYGYYRNASKFSAEINRYSKDDIIQFMVHPGFYSKLFKHKTNFSNLDRVNELKQLFKIKKYCNENNIEIVSYEDIYLKKV